MWLAAFLIEKNAKYWKNWLLFWNFGIKCCITWSKLMQIMWFFYNSTIFHLIYQFTKFYFFRKYVPAVKTMNESMNESMNEWMKKMAVTWVDKNESFFKRTHKMIQKWEQKWSKNEAKMATVNDPILRHAESMQNVLQEH